MKPVVLHSKASAELDAAIAYYEKRRPGLGFDFLLEVEKATRTIARNPSAFPLYKNTQFRKRVLKGFPYILFYAESEENIWVAALAHQSRKPDYWIKRSPQ